MPERVSHAENKTQNTRARYSLQTIYQKISELVPHAEEYNTKYQSAFHTRKTSNLEELCLFESVANERRT